MTTYAFLSDDWITACRALREEHLRTVGAPKKIPSVRMNLVVNDVPFGPGTVDAHLDTSHGNVEMDLGHLDSPDATVTAAYDTAKSILIDGNLGAAMEAMQLGRIQFKGNMMKMLALTSINNDPTSEQLAEKVRAITA